MHCLKKLSSAGYLLLSACAMVGPDYKEPVTQAQSQWLADSPSIKKSPINNTLWWNSFHDSVLSALIEQGYNNNLNLQIAGVHVLQTRAQLAQSVGGLYPQQQAATGNYTYNRIGGSSLNGLLPPDFDTATLGFTANWELDFWGKYRRAIHANDANFLASVAAYDQALITLTADIAITYIQFRTTQSLIRTTQANIAVQTAGLKIAQARFNAGQTSLVDVEQAQTELSQTQATLPSLKANLQRQKDALALLLGKTPNGINEWLKVKQNIPKAPKQIQVGIPKEVLARRPDIYQARLQAIAQSESIGAVKANLYPALSLSGTFAFSSNNIANSSIGDIFQWSNRTITAGPSFTWPLLNYGQITNAVRAQDAVFQQALLNYINLVLKAQQEVQDDITDFIEANHAVALLTKANHSATETLKLTMIRYKEGETDFTPVLNAEQQQLRIQTSLINAQGNVPTALVTLYRALGGGWEIRGCHDLVAQEIKKDMASRTNWGSLLEQKNHQPPTSKSQQLNQLYLPKW
jgi:NodT family efflux transporter outer membrane factor (OMF) lipoprotein